MKMYRALIYILPAVLFFSYQPLIGLGANETMNLELSLPLIWLVAFDMLALGILIRERKLREIFQRWRWLLLPAFMTVSLIWSHDTLRGVLTGGILWLIYLAVMTFVIMKREIATEKFRKNFLRVLLGTSVAVCGWCWAQCALDTAGVGREYTLMCPGCPYQTFGFPHANGFAAEPQFMGNLLLAPIIIAVYLWLEKKYFSRKILAIIIFVLMATMFLTLSRGAIYAMAVALGVLTVERIVRRREWRVMWVWPLMAVAFLFTLNLQGVMAELSRTNDTYVSGVSKAVNQLSLGVIDLGGGQVKQGAESAEVAGGTAENGGETDEDDGETTRESDMTKEESIYDGYVEVSTNERVDSWKGAWVIWTQNPQAALLGVGLGSAPLARYETGTLDTPKEIINNEYITLLVELGAVGMVLVIMTIIMIVRATRRSLAREMLLILLVAYMVSLCFFSGLPNALHIYLLTGVVYAMTLRKQVKRRMVK